MCKSIKKQVYIVECEIMRKFCRHAAKKARRRGNYERVKDWNDVAYQGDVTLAAVREW